MSNEFEKASILFSLAQIDNAFKEAREIIQLQKLFGIMTPELSAEMQKMFKTLFQLQEDREKLIKLANEKYDMNLH